MTRVLSLCSGMGLMDRAFMDAGFDVIPGCEIDSEQRLLYGQLCGGEPLAMDIADLAECVGLMGAFDGVIGGPPCQSHTKLRAMRKPKFPDLTGSVVEILATVKPRWFVFENVNPVQVPGAAHVRLDAMHFGKPHQSRPRWFTFSKNLTPPEPIYRGNVDDLFAYSIVAGRIYGPNRGAALQGYPAAARLRAPCRVIQKGLANAVHYGLAREWAECVVVLGK